MPLSNSSLASAAGSRAAGVQGTVSCETLSRGASGRTWLFRFGWTSLGALFLVVGILGIYLPGIPTTGPLILASFLFSKGNPQLREQMLQAPLLAAYRGYLDGSKPFTRAMRCWALACMWLSIALSCWLMSYASQLAGIALPACILGGVAGSVCILAYRRA